MDMNFCQSLETLCLNFLKSAEFESKGERGRSGGKKKKCPSCLQTWEMPLSALCCLGVMQISSGCLSRLNRDQNRQWSNRYKAGRRSAATEKTENTQTDSKMYAEECTQKYIHFKCVCSHIHKDKKHKTLCNYTYMWQSTKNTLQLYTNILVNPMPSARPAEGTKLQLLVNSSWKNKEWQILAGGERPQLREHNKSTLTLK